MKKLETVMKYVKDNKEAFIYGGYCAFCCIAGMAYSTALYKDDAKIKMSKLTKLVENGSIRLNKIDPITGRTTPMKDIDEYKKWLNLLL